MALRGLGPGPATLYVRFRASGCQLVTLAWRPCDDRATTRWLAFRPPGVQGETVTCRLDLTVCPDLHRQPVDGMHLLFKGDPVDGVLHGLWTDAAEWAFGPRATANPSPGSPPTPSAGAGGSATR